MSGIDSEQEKQPISSVNGDNDLHSPGKDAMEEQTPPVEETKSTAETETVHVSCHNESVEAAKDEGDEDKTKQNLDAETTVNGISQSDDHQKNSEQSENLEESPVVETKPSETPREVLDDKQVNGESCEVVAGKEGESNKSEQSHETVTTETNGEQGETSVKSKEAKQGQETVAMDTNGEQGEVLAAGKTSEPTPEPVAMETNGEDVKVEVTVPSEAESVPTKVKGQTEVEVPVVEKKRSVSIDSPVNVKEQDEIEDKTKQGRSKTVGDVEGIATSPVKEDVAARSKTIWYTNATEDTPSNSDSTAAEPEETVSYSTSIVGGVVHRVPINTYSPKGQRKSKEGSPQTPPKKRSVIGALFGKRKKSKGSPESPPGANHNGKEEDKENQLKFPESSPSSEDAEKKEIAESSAVTPKENEETAVKDATKPIENGISPEVEDTSGTETNQETEGKASTEVEDTSSADVKQEAEGKAAAVIEEGGGDVEVHVKPTVEEQSEEGIKEETTQDPKEPKESEKEPQAAQEESVPVEGIPPEKQKKSAEETDREQSENKDSKDAVKRVHAEPSEEDKTSQPSPKKKKTPGIFGGFFARRKSKKSKDLGDASPGAEKGQGDIVEEQQDGSPSTQPTSEGTGTVEGGADQSVVLPDAGDAAAMNGQENTASPKQEVSEGVISPAFDQTVESVEQELTDKEIVGRQETETTETEKPEVEGGVTAEKPEDLQKSPEETFPTKEADDIADKTAKDVARQETAEPITAQDSQPKAQQEGEQLIQPNIEVSDMVAGESEVAEDKTKVIEPAAEEAGEEKHVEKASPEAEEEDTFSREPITLRKEVNPSYSPKAARHMQMRISYAEKDGEGGKEVEVIGTPERVPGPTNQKGKPDHGVSCRSLGEADHEGWLSKKGGMFLSGWKRKWVVLKDGKLYYFKTAFDLEAGGIINMEGVTVAQAPETKKNFCFKCEQPGAKPQVSVFMADTKEDMDKWLTVLAAASRGEVIQKPKQNQLTVRDEVVMRKRTGSNTAQRHSSVLAVGGRHDFLEDEEDFKATRRRSTPGSFSKDAPKETEEKGKESAILSVTPPEPIEEQPSEAAPTSSNDQQPKPSKASPAPSDTTPAPSDTPPAPSDTTPAPSDQPPKPSDTAPAPSDATPAPSDTTPAPSDTTPTPSDTTPAPSNTTPAPSDATPVPSDTAPAPSHEHAATVDAPPISEPTDDSQKENIESEERRRTTNTVTVVVDEVFVGNEKVILESASSVEVSTSEQESSVLECSNDTVPAVSREEDKGTEGSSNICVDVAAGSEKQESPTDAESTVDKTDGAVSITTTESIVTVVETVKTSMEISETVETSTVVSVVETEVQSSPPATETSQLKPEVKEEVALSESSSVAPLESERSETPPPDSSSSSQLAGEPSESSTSPPESPSKTKWYFSLDRKQAWSVAPELEEEKSSKRPKSSESKSSNRGSIKSTSSDKGSIKSMSEEDQLMVMCRSIRQARLSIYGEHLLDGEERLRKFSNAQDSDDALVRLKTLERTLKDKEQHLADLEELLSQPNINRRSIYEWKIRNSVLLEELFLQDDIDGQEEVENAAEGEEGETQKKENVEEEVGKKEGQEESVDKKADKIDEAKEEAGSSKDQSDGIVGEKLTAQEEQREKTDEQAKSAKDEQQFVDKDENKEKEGDKNSAEKGTEEQQKSPAESSTLPDSDKTLESETAGEKQEQEKDISAESSNEVKSSEESEGQQESEDTHL